MPQRLTPIQELVQPFVDRHRDPRVIAIDLLRAGNPAEAVDIFQKLPPTPDVLANMGLALRDLNDAIIAEDCFNEALAVNPSFAPAFAGLSGLMIDAGRIGEAAALLERALPSHPQEPALVRALAKVRMEEGAATDATKLMHWLAGITGEAADFSQSCFYALHAEPDEICVDCLHKRYAERFLKPFADAKPPAKTWDGKRAVRVGYMSPHFRRHTVTKFLEPVIENHSDAVDLYFYSDVTNPDAVTERLKSRATVWRDTFNMDSGWLASRILSDRIDVLVDLCGHLDLGGRMPLFALRPAPVMLNYIGYPHATHVPGMIRVTDAVCDPDDTAEPIVRLSGCAWAFRPDATAPKRPPREGVPPVFGALNRAGKITPAVARQWATYLRDFPESPLLVLSSGGELNTGLRKNLEAAGVHPNRLVPSTSPEEYLAYFSRIDVLLDTAPYSGMTTTADALAMGVGVQTWPGDCHRARVTASLKAAGGSLMDGARVAGALEEAMRELSAA